MSVCLLEGVGLRAARPEDVPAVRRLFRAYADWLAVDLCFQGFERELLTLPGAYAPPGGRLVVAHVDAELIGCVGLRALGDGIGEMKRLWVEPGWAGRGIGRALAERAVLEARAIGYQALRLDTLPARMPAAERLYASLGFVEIAPYYLNPLPGVRMLELDLRGTLPSGDEPAAPGSVVS
ncbi:MAG TPA: GNAT family N-acetyltransferase [Geminicoccaceae bacterium]